MEESKDKKVYEMLKTYFYDDMPSEVKTSIQKYFDKDQNIILFTVAIMKRYESQLPYKWFIENDAEPGESIVVVR